MQCRIVEAFARQGHDVWLYDRDISGLRVFRPMFSTWEEISGNVEVEPTLCLPHGGLEALASAIGQHVSSSDATVDALGDTRDVRDRLLTIVEDAMKPLPWIGRNRS